MTLANIADNHHRLRAPLAHGAPLPSADGCRQTFARLIDSGISQELLYDTVSRLSIELVLTAHPTQVVRRTLLQRYNAIAELLNQRDLGTLNEEDFKEALLRELTIIWHTDEVIRRRPSALDEARGGLAVLEQELWGALPDFVRQLDRHLKAYTGRELSLEAAPFRFGSWMGGDRDGNPNVTAETTLRATRYGRWTAADLFSREVDALREELPMRSCSDELREHVGTNQEPYRELLRQVSERLKNTRIRMECLLDGRTPPEQPHYEQTQQLREMLFLCFRSLCETGQEIVARGRLLDLIRRVQCFGLTMARLDIRQESERHTEAIDAITRYLGLGSFIEWDEQQRQEFLIGELSGKRPLIPSDLPAPDTVTDVLQTFRMAKQIGPDALGAYVISMTHAPSDVLAVELLQKAVGNTSPMRVVPLFETLDDLKAAGGIMDRLFSIPWYHTRIAGHQEIMIGYSDSAKDGGRLAANWALYQTQEEIVAVCKKHSVLPTLFHGRGGTVARGGGPTHLAILSQPPGSVDGRLRVTEQGEMIQAKFGTPKAAILALELYAAATVDATLAPAQAPELRWRECLTELAEVSCDRYRDTVRHNPHFVEYFRYATPEVELSMLNIGSRPARRKPDGGIASLRAIPWIFAWTQNRLCLPSWLGVGAAIDHAVEHGYSEQLREMYEEWPFFRSLIDLVDMVVAKADETSALRYDQGLVPEPLLPLGQQIRGYLRNTIRRVLEVANHSQLLEAYPEGRHSLAARDPYMDPINLLQVELLRRLRRAPADQPPDPSTWDAFVMTVNGIAAGMRNTG